MRLQTRPLEYRDGNEVLEGIISRDAEIATPRPCVLVAHAWRGRSDFEGDKAAQLAALGYVGFAIDLFGKGALGKTLDENRSLIRPFMEDRAHLQRRMLLAVEQARALPEVDPARVAAIGFCFGGLCVLDLARMGADVNAVVSFHGLLTPPGNTEGNVSNAKVLVLHGWDDPLAPLHELLDLGHELTRLGADWQIHTYGNARHAFTNPQANDPNFGTVYHPEADRRSWLAMQAFLRESLSN